MNLLEISNRIKLAHRSVIEKTASIAVFNGPKILMGKRRDSNRYTLPGGHIDPGESPHEGACRELKEEAGFPIQPLTFLGTRSVQNRAGNPVIIHVYKLETYNHPTFTTLDPDEEVERWEWIDVSQGLPDHVKSSLHHRKNVTLEILGLL